MRSHRALAATVVLLLGSCATVQNPSGFSGEQVAALKGSGFEQVGDNYELGLEDRILFAFDRSDLRPETVQTLAQLAKVLLSVGIDGAMIEGHADSVGDATHNQQLSQLRAEAVKLTFARQGMPMSHIRTWGAGESDPIASNDTEEGRRQNRRVVIVVTPGDASGGD
jgi:OOP family OmpA-OmpF porin